MPLYEYECDACGRRFERIQKFSDPPVSACPDCGGAVRKLLSSPAIQFRGSGFYITDYVKSGAGSDAKDDKKTAEPAASTANTSADASKPASETAAKSGDSAAKTDTAKTPAASPPSKT